MNDPFNSKFRQWVLWVCIVLSVVAMSSCYSSKKIQSYNELPRQTSDFLEKMHQEDEIVQMEIYRGYNFRDKSMANHKRCVKMKSSVLPCGNISTIGLYLPNRFYAVMLQDSTKYLFTTKGEWKYMENVNGIEELPFFQQIPDSHIMAGKVWARKKESMGSNETLRMEDYKIIGIYSGFDYAIVFKCIDCVGAPTYYWFKFGRLKAISSFI